MQESVSIVAACRNEVATIERFLASLQRQTGVDGELEAVFADGQSSDGTSQVLQEYAARHPKWRVLPNVARIASAGLNAAIRASSGDIVVRMDAHTEYAPDYVSECLRSLHSTGADVVGGPALIHSRTLWGAAVACAHRSPFFAGGSRVFDAGYEGPVDTVAYGCWRRKTLVAAGLFDEAMARNQDDELSFRIRERGGVIWQSRSIRSWYQPRRTLTALARQYFDYGYWKTYGMRKHGRPFRMRHLAPGAFIACVTLLGWAKPRLLGRALRGYMGVLLGGQAAAARDIREFALTPGAVLVTVAAHLGYGTGTIAGALRHSLHPVSVSLRTP